MDEPCCVWYWFQGKWVVANRSGDLGELRNLIQRAGYVARLGTQDSPPATAPHMRELRMCRFTN